MLHAQIAAGATCCLAFAALLIAIAATGGAGASAVAKARLCQWSNAFFLLPVVRALTFTKSRGDGDGGGGGGGPAYPAAWGAAGVFFMTFAASVLHHGCLADEQVRDAVAAETVWLLWLGVAVVLATVAVTARHWLATAAAARPAWIAAGLVVAAAASVVVLALALAAVGRGRMDGCLWPHARTGPAAAAYAADVAPALATVWDVVDFVTAFSALVMAALFLMQVTDTLALGLFWTFAVLLTALQLYRTLLPPGSGGGIGQGTIIAVVAAAGGLVAACQLAVCCSYPPALVRRLCRNYDVADVLATALVGAAAITIFLADNVPVMHSVWHVLGATALYFAIESRYRDSWLFFGSSAAAVARV